MCVLLLVFAVPALIILGLPPLALILGWTWLYQRVMTRKYGENPALSKAERERRIGLQIGAAYILLLVGFMMYLAIKYAVT